MSDPLRPLDRMQQVFDLVARHGLRLDGAELGHGLPARAIPLGELRGLLLHPATPPAARDAALAVLVTRARGGDERWRIGLVGVLLPGLRAAAGRLGHRFPGERADLEAEVLAGLAEAIGLVPLDRGGLAGRLVYAAMKRGHRLLRAEWTEHTNRAGAGASAAPVRPWSHPDLVLVDAVEAGVISAAEAAPS